MADPPLKILSVVSKDISVLSAGRAGKDTIMTSLVTDVRVVGALERC